VATVFYLVLAFFSRDVDFSLIWFLVSLFFDGGKEVVTYYRYTTNPSLDGQRAD
jgi:hypothetical protein